MRYISYLNVSIIRVKEKRSSLRLIMRPKELLFSLTVFQKTDASTSPKRRKLKVVFEKQMWWLRPSMLQVLSNSAPQQSETPNMHEHSAFHVLLILVSTWWLIIIIFNDQFEARMEYNGLIVRIIHEMQNMMFWILWSEDWKHLQHTCNWLESPYILFQILATFQHYQSISHYSDKEQHSWKSTTRHVNI